MRRSWCVYPWTVKQSGQWGRDRWRGGQWGLDRWRGGQWGRDRWTGGQWGRVRWRDGQWGRDRWRGDPGAFNVGRRFNVHHHTVWRDRVDVRAGVQEGTCDQGLTLVHFSAQLEPYLTQENTLHNP